MTKILYGNVELRNRSGTEVVTLETVLGLQRLGHEVAVLVSRGGAAAESLSAHGIPVLTRADRLPWRPAIVHANHLPQSLAAARCFPEVPQIFVCHDATGWHSVPARLPCVRRYCAVDRIGAERAAAAVGISADEVLWLPNAVDLTRFSLRSELPPAPRRALLVTTHAAHAAAVQTACDEHGIPLDRLGVAFGQVVEDFAERLPHYDLVFAAARNALESLAAGCAVIVTDGRGLAGMANSRTIDTWRQHNLGQRILSREPTRDALSAEIATYDAVDARRVSAQIRRSAGLDIYLQQLLGVYHAVLSETNIRPLDPERTRAEFPAALCTALPHLLAGTREWLPAEDVAALAEDLPPEFNRLWKCLCELQYFLRSAESTAANLRAECRQSAEQIAALQAAVGESTRQVAAAERVLGSRSALLRRLWERVLRGKRTGTERAA